ncbi:MAG: GNAT family N-acetyltransferase [Pseudomonadota bacterium]
MDVFASAIVARAKLPTGHDIQSASEDNLPAVIALLADDVLGAAREVSDRAARQRYEAAFAAISIDPNHAVAVLTRASCAVGTCQLSFLPGLAFEGSWRAQIESVRIAKSERGNGLGRCLMRWAVAAASAKGCRIVQLTTNVERPDAHAFYARLGFQPTHTGFKLMVGEGRKAPQ